MRGRSCGTLVVAEASMVSRGKYTGFKLIGIKGIKMHTLSHCRLVNKN